MRFIYCGTCNLEVLRIDIIEVKVKSVGIKIDSMRNFKNTIRGYNIHVTEYAENVYINRFIILYRNYIGITAHCNSVPIRK